MKTRLNTNSGTQTIPVPSYSGDVIPTPILNAVKKHFASSQEKQGDDQLIQARDLVTSGVQSMIAENDLRVIEEKIAL
jgi:hypothetical protein